MKIISADRKTGIVTAVRFGPDTLARCKIVREKLRTYNPVRFGLIVPDNIEIGDRVHDVNRYGKFPGTTF